MELFTSFVSLFLLSLLRLSCGQKCSADAMSRCTDPLRVVTDNKDLGFATSQQELQEMCPKLMDGLRCIDNFTTKCLEEEHRAYFNTLYTGTTQVIVDLCQEGHYQEEYLKHAPCMRKAQTEYESCADEYQLRIKTLNKGGIATPEEEEDNVQVLCCSFQRYLHCSEHVVNGTCGMETASFTKGFLDRMSGPLVQGHCQTYEMGSAMCAPKSRSGLEESVQYALESEESPNSGVTSWSSSVIPFASVFILSRIF